MQRILGLDRTRQRRPSRSRPPHVSICKILHQRGAHAQQSDVLGHQGKSSGPTDSRIVSAIGGLGPLIVEDLPYGVGNKYKAGAPVGTAEPDEGEPSQIAKRYLIQRNNKTFIKQNDHSADTGKAVLAYCVERNRLLVGLQEDGTTPGMKISQLAYDLLNLGFDDAVFLDGSDSATLMVDGKMVVTPGGYKDHAIVVGVGFTR